MEDDRLGDEDDSVNDNGISPALSIPESVDAKRDWLGALKAVAAVTGYEVFDQGDVIECSPAHSSASTRRPNDVVGSVSSHATYRFTYSAKGREYTVGRVVNHRNNELVGVKKPQSAVLYLALEMKNPQSTRPAIIRNLATSYDGPEWKVPQSIADCVGEENFACGTMERHGRSVGLAKCDNKWFVYYFRERCELYHVGFYETYAQALQAMMDMAWSLGRAEEYARELAVGNGEGVQQTIDMFLTGHSEQSPYAPENRIKVGVPTYRTGPKVASIGEDNGARQHGDEMCFNDETDDGLWITEPGFGYRPDRKLMCQFAAQIVGAAVFAFAFGAVCMVVVPTDMPGCLGLIACGVVCLVEVAIMVACVRNFSRRNFHLLKGFSWFMVGIALVVFVIGLVLALNHYWKDGNWEPAFGIFFLFLYGSLVPDIVNGKYKNWRFPFAFSGASVF
ncbi:hypothetical protein OZX67_01660 [Bifidobacterium sp. ESL0728]|uniref:hypothetical protein n=1 Tax=Bifidobacterium sp. ESL0728 TaxID=2983220 RepID=UPI0023F803C8|nr:hypothetical protein [Bifidobacterium sp. ESL0728]WEV59302.1 hypothetical protein OZX67_01660 [Bifidobacterium sp. ESL0728]